MAKPRRGPAGDPGYSRHRNNRGARTVSQVRLLSTLNTPGGGDKYLREAADVIAAAARTLASGWEKTGDVPRSIAVEVSGNTATISASAPAARPAELRHMHPLFGDREHWYGPPGAPFLVPAADASSDAALAKYAKKVDAWAAKAGYR